MSNFILKTLETRELKLNTIRLRGFYGGKLRKGSGGGGSGDGFPQLPGDVTRWYFGGLTNEMMAAMDDPRIEDADHKGGFLSFKNLAWGGMSGVGGYADNWNSSADWDINSYWVNSHTDHKLQLITASTVVQMKSNNIYNAENVYKNILNVNGLTEAVNKGSVEGLRISATDPITSKAIKTFSFDTDGVIQISFDDVLQDYCVVYFVYGNNTNDIDITIEQLPLYPGFILGDGVDDLAVTEKELNFEDTYTVYTAFIPFQSNPIRNMILCGANSKKTFSMQYSSLVYVSFIAGNNYYINADFVNGLNLFACKRNGNNICIKNLLTNKVVTGMCGDWVENAGLYYLWKNATYASFAKVAIAGQTICNGYFSTDEDDEKVLNWYKKQYPWLFPDQAWTVTGKTNEDKDRATIANITDNGNNLVLSNFGFAEGSGYGLYNAAFSSKSNLQYWSKQKIQFSKSQIETNKVLPYLIMECKDELSYNIKIKMTGFDSGVKLKWGFTDGYTYIEGDGIHVLNKKSTTIRHLHIEYSEDFDPDHVVTIEQIPEYEGYLVTDGVDDKITSSAFKMGKDWTVVGDWKFINDESKNAGIIKPSSLYVYNALNGVSIFINSGSIGNNIKENKGFNAICSNGRAYDRNWTEYSELKVEEVTKSNSELKIGASSNDTTYTRMAFKNFAIYPKVLSKDDCIKAYNYLQTLKAK